MNSKDVTSAFASAFFQVWGVRLKGRVSGFTSSDSGRKGQFTINHKELGKSPVRFERWHGAYRFYSPLFGHTSDYKGLVSSHLFCVIAAPEAAQYMYNDNSMVERFERSVLVGKEGWDRIKVLHHVG